ncbi:monocarboxylate transporter 4 [Nematostella vectensis]|uniref:monocarboxylate transporter 4 n=1 Tax=Nematostella vectensis TaxID=45351 RepID=UPI0020770CF6|nr:monocarboxylate transporter 4 [Nematostella vectensis]
MKRSWLSCFDPSINRSGATDNVWSWCVCFAATLCNALHFGVSLSFGVLLPYLLEHFNASLERTALVGSLAIAMTFTATLLAGRLIDRYGRRIVSFAGGLTCALGLTLTSFAHSINMLYCYYSLTFGLGCSLLFTSAYLVIPKHFNTRRALAIGIVSSGGGLGFLALGPLLQYLLATFDWKNTCRIMAATFLLSCALSIVYDSKKSDECLSERIQPQNVEPKDTLEKKQEEAGCVFPRNRSVRIANKAWVIKAPSQRLLDWSVWKYPAFSVHTLSLTLACVGHYIPQIFMVKYCESLGISSAAASRLLIYIGLATMTTRVLVGEVCDLRWLSASAMSQVAKTLSGAMAIAVAFAVTYGQFVVVSVLYGLADGAMATTLNFLLMSTVPTSKMSSAFGFGSIATSVAVAAGPPLSGFLTEISRSSRLSFIVAGGIIIFSALIPLTLYCFPSTRGTKSDGKRVLVAMEEEKAESLV